MFQEGDIVEFKTERLRSLFTESDIQIFKIRKTFCRSHGSVTLSDLHGNYFGEIGESYIKLADPRNIVRKMNRV